MNWRNKPATLAKAHYLYEGWYESRKPKGLLQYVNLGYSDGVKVEITDKDYNEYGFDGGNTWSTYGSEWRMWIEKPTKWQMKRARWEKMEK